MVRLGRGAELDAAAPEASKRQAAPCRPRMKIVRNECRVSHPNPVLSNQGHSRYAYLFGYRIAPEAARWIAMNRDLHQELHRRPHGDD